MFGFLSKEVRPVPAAVDRQVVGCLGKMPVHADFIRHSLSVREAVALDQWIQDGVTLLNMRFGDDWRERFQASPRTCFLFGGAGEERTITGLVVPGKDRSGRDYPFAEFLATADQSFKSEPALAPLALRDYYRAANAVVDYQHTYESTSDLTTAVDATKSCVDLPHREILQSRCEDVLSSLTMQDFWRETLPDAGDGEQGAFVATVLGALHTVARRSARRVPWGLRVPLPPHGDVTGYVVFWLQLCTQILQGHNWRAHCFWNETRGGISAQFTVFFRPIPASYLALLLDPGRNDGTVLDVLEEMRNVPAEGEPEGCGVDGNATLLDALEALRCREVRQ